MPGNREQCRRCWERSVTLLKKIEISASILSADMANLTAVTEGLERDGLDMLHFDVMDGQFVPNITFGMPVLAAVDHCTNLFLDVHLMIADPIRYVKQFAEAGISAYLIDEHNRITMTAQRHTVKRTDVYRYVSLLPYTEQVTGVTLQGFYYNAQGLTLKLGESIGVSNELIAECGLIEFESGLLIVIESRD